MIGKKHVKVLETNEKTVLRAYLSITLRGKCPYLEFFWSVFSRIRIEYGEILRISPYSDQMWEKMNQKNSEYEHFIVVLAIQIHIRHSQVCIAGNI